MKYAVAITLFNPSKENLDNLQNYLNVFDEIFIYDNSITNKEYYMKIPKDKKIHYFFNGKNEGLPYAFNKILDHNNLRSCDFLCTMDQDSIFDKIKINKMKNFINKINLEDIAIVAPYVIYNKNDKVPSEEIQYKEWVICSGSFINLNIIRKNSIRYDEKYFVDKFEIDFCKQLRLLKYKIIIYTKCIMKQELGTYSGHKHSNHSPIRHYYLFRNRLYFNYKYYNGKKAFVLSMLQTIKHICLIILFEENKLKKIKVCFNGINDYKKRRFYEK